MERGFVHLWRKSLDSRIFQNAELWKVWTWCLMKANHKPKYYQIVTGKGSSQVLVNRGQFVFGRNQAAHELGQTPSGLWKRCLLLQKLENVNIQSNNHYSIISIINWDSYQAKDEKSDSQGDRQVTGKEQPSDTNKNDKNYKNKNKKLCSTEPDFPISTESGADEPQADFYITKTKKRLTGSRLEIFKTFWKSWMGTCGHGMAKADAADVLMGLEWKKNGGEDGKVFNQSFLEKILKGAQIEAANRSELKSAGRTPVNAARWLRERRWEEILESQVQEAANYAPVVCYEPPPDDPEKITYAEFLELQKNATTAQ